MWESFQVTDMKNYPSTTNGNLIYHPFKTSTRLNPKPMKLQPSQRQLEDLPRIQATQKNTRTFLKQVRFFNYSIAPRVKFFSHSFKDEAVQETKTETLLFRTYFVKLIFFFI